MKIYEEIDDIKKIIPVKVDKPVKKIIYIKHGKRIG